MSVYYKENPDWLRTAFKSIETQTVPPSEIILVEDGPLTVELDSVVNDLKKNKCVKIVSLPENKGLGLALREGIHHCNNELIARMDSDDVSLPNRCEKQLNVIVARPELDVVGCWENEFWGDSLDKIFSCHKVPELHDDIVKFMHRRCGLLHPTVFFKKNAVLRAGNYQHRPLFEDYDLFVRMLQTGSRAYNIQESLYFLRVNPNLYKRRGGYRYANTLLKFKYEMWRKKFYTTSDFIVSGLGHYCVCLVPNKIRMMFYKAFLR